jgi:hypothetical protein
MPCARSSNVRSSIFACSVCQKTYGLKRGVRTSVFATGNNFTPVGDLCRRVITINLDAGMERPELRQFKFDPVERVLEDRGKGAADKAAV